MSIFRDFFAVKQKPVFTGLRFGFGGAAGGGAGGGPVSFTIKKYNTSNFQSHNLIRLHLLHEDVQISH